MWAYRIREFQLAGGFGWVDSAKYDIAAKAEGDASPDQMRLMLQTLLEERFQLKLRHETKEHPLYVLVAAKTGLKLRESGADCEAIAREDPAGNSHGQCGRGSVMRTSSPGQKYPWSSSWKAFRMYWTAP
jgi:uncharacterized protein (TIGR03435 family)